MLFECSSLVQADNQKQQKWNQIYEVQGTVKLRREKRCTRRGSTPGILKALSKRY
jgi:hypothetical protein